MKIFELRLSLDPIEMGSAHSNSLSMKVGYDYEAPDSVYYWKKLFKKSPQKRGVIRMLQKH